MQKIRGKNKLILAGSHKEIWTDKQTDERMDRRTEGQS